MKQPLSLESRNSPRTAKRPGRVSRAKPRQRPLRFEALEGRVVLALTPQMVLDINVNTPSANPLKLVAIGSTAYFTANDRVHGVELWKSDGTAAGTLLVKDIFPGSSPSYPVNLTNVDGTLFFTANDVIHGQELWKSDGTAAGTTLVKDISPNGTNWAPWNFMNVNGTLYFAANDGVNGLELWKSDGTAAGTTLVKNIAADSSSSYPGSLTDVDGTLFFTADDGTNGRELWKSDGTEAGTVLVKDIYPGSYDDGYGYVYPYPSDPRELTNVNGTLYFVADDGSHGAELWKSDGTSAGTALVKDIVPDWRGYVYNIYPDQLFNFQGTLFFAADDDTHGIELWKSDGTAAGTVQVKDIVAGVEGSVPINLTEVNGVLYFIGAWTSSRGLWRSDGTAAGTTLVKSFPFPDKYGAATALTNLNGMLFFAKSDRISGWELWKSDGTPTGTTLVKDINPGPAWSIFRGITNINGTLMFAADDGTHRNELWKSDGTSAGTVLVKDINNSRTFHSYPRNLTDVGGTIYFTADDGIARRELWSTDGTAAGTSFVKDIFPGVSNPYYGVYLPNTSDPSELTNVNGTLFFTANDGTNGTELWRSDGTAAGTSLVKDIRPGAYGSSPHNLTVVNGTLYFTADDGVNGFELWKSDGTATGTTLVKDIYPGGFTDYYGNYYPYSSFPSGLTNVNGTLFFTVTGGLWKSDGTEDGTVNVRSVGGSSLTNVNGTLFFTANDGTHGTELWKSDGTGAGTVLIKDIRPGSTGSYPNSPSNVNGTLFFITGYELWKSDGTTSGTVQVKEIFPGANAFGPSLLTNFNGTLFFRANTATTGYELWKSDGTTTGTVLVKDINPGSASSFPSQLTNVSGKLFFQANDGTGVRKLWQSDGTEAGTVVVTDLLTDTLRNFNGTLFFSTDDGVHGWELWKLVDDTTPPALTISVAMATEGHAGTQSMTFSVTLSAASTLPVTVNYATLDGTAAALSDYNAVSGTISFAPGETSKFLTVLVNGDRLAEQDETFFVNLSGATNASISDAQGLGTIFDDEPRWHNFAKPFDVRGGSGVSPDDHVDAGDALAIINYINAFDFSEVPEDAVNGLPFGFLDTNGDNNVAPDDALSVINAINAGFEGEGEPTAGAEGANELGLQYSLPSGQTPFNELIGLLALDVAFQPKRRR